MSKHPFQWHVVRSEPYDPNYPYTLFSRIRGWDKVAYPNLECAIKKVEDYNQSEKWDEHYPPHEIKRCLEKYKGDIFSESYLNNLIWND
jgi:hypothetical protein